MPRNSKLWQGPCGLAIVDFVVFLGMLVDFFAKEPFRGKASMPNGLLSNFVHAHEHISFLTGNPLGTICRYDSPGLLHSANCSFETFSSVHVLNFTKCHQSTLVMTISGRIVKVSRLLAVHCKALPDRPGSCSNRNSPQTPLIWRVENSFGGSRRLYMYNSSCRRLQESHH